MRNVVFLDLDETLTTTFPLVEMDNLDAQIESARLQLSTAQTPAATIFRRKMMEIYRNRKAQIPDCKPLNRSLGVLKRPGVDEAIIALSSVADVHLFTAADMNYAREVLAITKTRIPGELFTTRDEMQLPDVSKNAWVLVDDLLNGEKVKMLGETDVEKYCYQVKPLDYGANNTPMTDYVEDVCRRLMARQMGR